ncbi:MAG: right-handed parallel beta-helix repeat-containing protein [Methanobrevibacter sp.]
MKFNKLLIVLIVLITVLSIGSISASDNNDSSFQTLGSHSDFNSTDVSSLSSSQDVSSDVSSLSSSQEASNNDSSSNSKSVVSDSINSLDISSTNKTVKSKTIDISPNKYSTYFDENGNIKSGISSGDTLDLSGIFTNKNFNINMPLTITSSSNNAFLRNCTILLLSGSDGSNISNIKFSNNRSFTPGVWINGTHDIIVNNINYYGNGRSAYSVYIQNSTKCTLSNSKIKTETGVDNQSWTHPGICLSASNYNTILNNDIEVGDNVGIYGSYYNDKKYSDNNFIIGNKIRTVIDNPTSWNYAIQMMGSNNLIENNTIIGSYRGISATMSNNTVRGNTIINITGVDFGNKTLITGGDDAIIVNINSIVENNKIINVYAQYAISIGGNCIVRNNTINNLLPNGYGIFVSGDNTNITNNNITNDNSAAICISGDIKNVIVDSNHINSNSYGILVIRESSKKYPKNLTLINNFINTTGVCAIDALYADNENTTINNNEVNGKDITYPKGMIIEDEAHIKYNGTKIIITPDTYSMYFDDNGVIVPGTINDRDILIFRGNFTNKTIIISSKVKIEGNNQTNLFNSTIKVSSPNVYICDLNITNNNPNTINQWGIYVYDRADYVYIVNNNINVTDDKTAYCIYLDDITGATVEGNFFTSNGNYLTYTILGRELYNSTINNNEIFTNGTGQVHGYESELCIDGVHRIQEIYRTYGILLLYSSNNNISSNYVSVSSKLANKTHVNSTNSIVGVDIYFDSNNNTVNNNHIEVSGNDNYIYGTGCLAAQTGKGDTKANSNKFISNDIILKGNNFVSGIIVGYLSNGTIVDNNAITLNSKNDAYGITLEISQNNTITNNIVNAKSGALYLLEMFSSNNNLVSNNIFNGNGSFVYGIAGYGASNNTINYNKIISNGDYNTVDKVSNHGDSIPAGIAGIYLIKNSLNNSINSNNITTNGYYAVNITENQNTVKNNYLIANNNCGNNAVNYLNENVSNNYPKNVNIDFDSDKKGNIIVKLTDDDSNPIVNETISYLINGTKSPKVLVSDENGQAIVNDLDGKIRLTVLFAGDDNYIKSNNSIIVKTVNKVPVKVGTKIVSYDLNQVAVDFYHGERGGYFVSRLIDENNKPLANKTVQVGFNGVVYTLTTDENGLARLQINLAFAGIYTFAVCYLGDGEYNGSFVVNKITISKKPTSLIVPNKKYGVKTKSKIITVTLQGKKSFGQGSILCAGRTVKVTVGGKTYTGKTNSKGVANIKVNINRRGTYTVTTKFDSDYGFDSSSMTSKLIIV